MGTFETLNACAVASAGHGEIVVLAPRQRYTREEALMFAAWLVAMATIGEDSDERPYGAIYERIEAVLQT